MGVIFLEPWARQFYIDLPALPEIAKREVTILGVSKLTCDPVGIGIWLDLCSLIQQVTGKKHTHKADPEAWFRNDPEEFVLPEGQVEGFMHEFCHWIVASDDDRLKNNLGLGKFRAEFTREDGLRNEERVWALEAWLFSPYITELELAKHISPEAHIRSASRWINDPLENLLYGLARASQIKLPVDLLRSILERWAFWLKQDQRELSI
jgi:hypothetical protein